MKVIIAIDDSPYSVQVVDSILHRRWPAHVEFKILTVLQPLCDCISDDVLTEFSDTMTTIRDRRKQAAQSLGERVRHKLESTIAGATANCEIREGLPRIEIINAAVDWQADQILIGAHGKDVCPRNLIGSVSRAVVNHAPCTVEVIRPRAHHRSLIA